MFGYVTANSSLLSKEDKIKYKSYYCGLCRELHKKGFLISSLSLNYDMVFLAIILDAVYEKQSGISKGRCIFHPFNGCRYSDSNFLSYAADMNIILTGYKLKDDISDDNSLKAKAAMKLLEKKFEKSSFEYKEKAEKISASLRELSEIEKSGRLLPDECAGLFGKILGEVFCIYDDEKGKALFEFGYSLGKFIYIIDACLDRDSDIRKKRYNPLIRFMKKDFRGILNLLMAECLEKYEVLNISVNKSLVENILLSGVWYKFEIRERKNK